MKVLHVLSDWIICDYVPTIMAHTPDEHYYIRFCSPVEKDVPAKYLSEKWKVRAISSQDPEYMGYATTKSWDIVWIHGLYIGKDRFLLRQDKRVKIVWSTWGFDYLRYGVIWQFGLRTTIRLWKYLGWYVAFKKLAEWVSMVTGVQRLLNVPLVRALGRIDYYSTVLPTEEPMMRRLLRKDAMRLNFHYVADKPLVKNYQRVNLQSRHILFGNSADITNNHLDLIPYFRHCQGYHVWAPLSYDYNGESKSAYADDVTHAGQKEIGSRFHPLVTFLPYQQYVELTQKCSVYIFGHRRQKAVGNIYMALKRGAVVIMNPMNPAYRYFLDNGIRIYSLRDLKRRGIAEIVAEFKPHQRENINRFEQVRGHRVLMRQALEAYNQVREDILKERRNERPGH